MKSHQSSLLSNLQSSFLCYQAIIINPKKLISEFIRRVCKVRTQDPENLIEEVKSLVSAWRFFANSFTCPTNYFGIKNLFGNVLLINEKILKMKVKTRPMNKPSGFRTRNWHLINLRNSQENYLLVKPLISYFIFLLRSSEIHLFYNQLFFYWHSIILFFGKICWANPLSAILC